MEKRSERRYNQNTPRNKIISLSMTRHVGRKMEAPPFLFSRRAPPKSRRLAAPVDFQKTPPSDSVFCCHPHAVLHSPPVHIPFHTVDVLVEKFPDTMVLSFDLHYAIVVKRWQKLIQPNGVVSNLRICLGTTSVRTCGEGWKTYHLPTTSLRDPKRRPERVVPLRPVLPAPPAVLGVSTRLGRF